MIKRGKKVAKGSANDISGNQVYLLNEGGFLAKFAVSTPEGGTPWSAGKAVGGSAWLDPAAGGANPGDSCCAAAQILGGASCYRSGNNFNYDPNASNIQYTITGPVWSPSWNGPFPYSAEERGHAPPRAAARPAATPAK